MKFNKKLLISALFGFSLFSFSPTAMADVQSDVAQAYQYIEQENYHQAFPILQQLAEQGVFRCAVYFREYVLQRRRRKTRLRASGEMVQSRRGAR